MKKSVRFSMVLCCLFLKSSDTIWASSELHSLPLAYNQQRSSQPLTISPAGCMVYVLLEKVKESERRLWIVNSPEGFTIADIAAPEQCDTLKKPTVTVVLAAGYLIINGRKTVRNVCLKPLQGFYTYGDRCYQGNLYLLYFQESWYVVNGLPIEDYVYSVLGSESWPGWPLEINKIFAIVFRTYVLAKRNEARKRGRKGRPFLYDILSTNEHQTYKGMHDRCILRQAVEETAGVILSYRGKPINAMYDTCCGGIVPAHLAKVDFVHSPYLKRPYACTFCASCKAYSWRASYTVEDIKKQLLLIDKPVRDITHMHISQRDKAGAVQEIVIKTGSKVTTLSGKQVYSLFKGVKSCSFSVIKTGKTIVFEGKGYGHLMGLCQWGARELVKHGWSCTNILSFYYPGAEIMRVSV